MTLEKRDVAITNVFTSAHAFMWGYKPHQTISGHEQEEQEKEEWEQGDGELIGYSQDSLDPKLQTPYIINMKCTTSITPFQPKNRGSKFVVMIKSEDEILSEETLCKKLNDCGEKEKRGKCIKLDDVFVATCLCNYPYYGDTCDESITEYLKKYEEILQESKVALTSA